MSSKQHQSEPEQTTNGDQRLVVWGERRKEPNWDVFLAALIAYALREIDGPAGDRKETDA